MGISLAGLFILFAVGVFVYKCSISEPDWLEDILITLGCVGFVASLAKIVWWVAIHVTIE